MKKISINNKNIQVSRELFHLVIGILMIVLGILIINRLNMMWYAIYFLALTVLVAVSLSNLYKAIINRDIIHLLRAIGTASVVVFLVFNQTYVVSVTTLIFGLWALFNASVHALEIYLKFRDGELGKLKKLIALVFDTTIGVLLLSQGFQNRLIINIQMGSYIIVYGIIEILVSVQGLLGHHVQLKLSAPVLYSAILPPVVVSGLKKHTRDEQDKPYIGPTKGNRISVYMHVKDYGFNRLGHIDLGYNGSIYSYGSYDEDNRSKHSIYGDGVLICGSESDFINFSVDHRTIVYQYIIELTEFEARAIEERLKDLLSDTYYFENPGKKGAHLTNLQEQSDFYSFYKFHNQPYKTYNLFTTNCVMLANVILESSGLKLFQLSGIITPGTYYSFLEELIISQKVPIKKIIHTYKA